jgi:hypothetical protein
MHRSGTSLLAGALASLGVDLGSRLIEGDDNNEEGYFEHQAIVALHKQAQLILDRRWTGPKGALDYPSVWWTWPQIRELRAELKGIVEQELAAARGPWGFKDPRTTRLLPMWQEIFAELDVEPFYFLSVRNPAAVAASIAKRDGLSAVRSQALWLQHNLDALRDLRGQRLHVLEYDRWFTDLDGQAERLWMALGGAQAARTAEIVEALSGLVHQGLRHHQARPDGSTRFMSEVYAALAEAAQTGEIPARVWGLLAEYEEAKRILSGWSEVIQAIDDRRAGNADRPVRSSGGRVSRLMRSLRARGDDRAQSGSGGG